LLYGLLAVLTERRLVSVLSRIRGHGGARDGTEIMKRSGESPKPSSDLSFDEGDLTRPGVDALSTVVGSDVETLRRDELFAARRPGLSVARLPVAYYGPV